MAVSTDTRYLYIKSPITVLHVGSQGKNPNSIVILLLMTTTKWLRGPPHRFLYDMFQRPFTGVKWPERETDNSLLLGA
jgi:hypothetical protein